MMKESQWLCQALSYMDKTKFLGAPKVCNIKGETMSSVTYDILTNWNAAENVIGTVWDTTASNTGKWEGAAGHMEKLLHRALLWVACRHHVAELHVKHANDNVRGGTSGRFYFLFTFFQ